METYIVIKNLPDAQVGTEVHWNSYKNFYCYKKSSFVYPNDTTFLTEAQVTQTPEFFCRAIEYPEYFAYKHPVYSREEIIALIKECFPKITMSGQFELSASKEIKFFEEKLRELGKKNAEITIKSLGKIIKTPDSYNRLMLHIYSTISDMQLQMAKTETHFTDKTYKDIQTIKEEIKSILNN
jgi:hypothetical protein